MISKISNFLLAVSIALLAVAQFRIGGQGLDMPLLFVVVGLLLVGRLIGLGADRFYFKALVNNEFLLILWCLILLFFLHLLDLVRTDGDLRVIQATLKLCVGVVVYVFFSVYRVDRNVFLFGLAFSSAAIVGFYVFNSYFVLGAPYLVNNLEEVTKAGRNQIALYLSSVTVLLTYFLIVESAKPLAKFFLSLSIFIHFIALIYCSSRSAWVSSFLGLLPMFVVYRVRSLIGLVVLISIVVFTSSFLSVGDADIVGDMLTSLSDRVMSIFSGVDPEGEESIAVRGELMISALNDFSSAPIVGIGVEQFLPRHNYVTHNTYLQYLVENGLVGLVLFLTPVFLVIRNSFRKLKRGLAGCDLNAGFAFEMAAFCFFINILFVNILGAPLFFVMLGFFVSQKIDLDGQRFVRRSVSCL